LAYYDQEGYFYLVGRKKNIIISGGINIYPEEIESKIRQHEAVSEVVVKGELDTMLGEIPVAEVTLAAGKSLNIAELRQFLSKDIAQYKHPRKLFIRDHFDKTATGKIART
jgi:long-chain acyl-CoA synthetase